MKRNEHINSYHFLLVQSADGLVLIMQLRGNEGDTGFVSVVDGAARRLRLLLRLLLNRLRISTSSVVAAASAAAAATASPRSRIAATVVGGRAASGASVAVTRKIYHRSVR